MGLCALAGFDPCLSRLLLTRIVISKVIFSPDSGGQQNPKTAIDAETQDCIFSRLDSFKKLFL
jgi:hypothetical protein